MNAAQAAGIEPVELLVAGENVEPALLAEVSTLAHPPRVIGVYRRFDLPRGAGDLTLALWRVADPGNVGTLIRTADAFDAAIALSSGCADPTGPKAVRASMGSIFRTPIESFPVPGGGIALVSHGGRPLSEIAFEPPLTLILGAERQRLPEPVLDRADDRATIPLAGGAESLNVAAAGAIALYEARRAIQTVSSPPE